MPYLDAHISLPVLSIRIEIPSSVSLTTVPIPISSICTRRPNQPLEDGGHSHPLPAYISPGSAISPPHLSHVVIMVSVPQLFVRVFWWDKMVESVRFALVFLKSLDMKGLILLLQPCGLTATSWKPIR